MKLLAVITTTASQEEARRIAAEVVQRGLGACAQISEIESFYTWKGAVQQDKEYRVVIKTTAELYGVVEQAIKAMHSYELPAIYAVPLVQVYTQYAEWVEDNTKKA
ncbi:MAG: divalent-cation tolerance protein CutA [Firmicutes bacterium]|jgi:periplasmic divalent cation tolerance protein|nr:divalent-cation tolerance protein CutA [Bacillota bacterium]